MNEFLETVLATLKDRILEVEAGVIFLRAQLGHHWREISTDPNDPGSETFEVECAHDIDRMKPLRHSAREGRINAKGIPCIYLCDDENTAMAETRPWIGSFVSLAQFKTLKHLQLVNCCDERHHGLHLSLELPLIRALDPRKREKITWGEISHAFSEPVSPTDVTAEYTPTQILSDLFRSRGYDGIRYKSLLGPGYNYALFDLDAADLLNCGLHQVKRVAFEFDMADNPYFNPEYCG